ncbi:hypothetical protein [Micromonospora sp. NPDC049891]|uniref:DUF6907 domain-containing protein n=1 Tax=Micromonospora sp. NPDC049891 TaxID=3155655 RepID=UPI0033D4AABA
MDTQQQAACPPWCPPPACEPDRHDGSVFHMSQPVMVDAVNDGATATNLLDVAVSRIDDDTPGQTTVDLAVAMDRTVGMTPEQTLAFIEILRQHALTAAGPDGLPMPVEQVRVGEQIRIDGGWETVELVTVDGWCCGQPMVPGHACRVLVGTDTTPDDNDAHTFDLGDIVQVRREHIQEGQ